LAARGWPGQWVALAGLINEGMEEGEPWRVWAGSLWLQGAGCGRWFALAGLINEGMEEGETLARLGLTLVGYKGWLGPRVAFAGFINEGMEEGEAGRFVADPETKALYYLSSRYIEPKIHGIEPKIHGVPVSDVFFICNPQHRLVYFLGRMLFETVKLYTYFQHALQA